MLIWVHVAQGVVIHESVDLMYAVVVTAMTDWRALLISPVALWGPLNRLPGEGYMNGFLYSGNQQDPLFYFI